MTPCDLYHKGKRRNKGMIVHCLLFIFEVYDSIALKAKLIDVNTPKNNPIA